MKRHIVPDTVLEAIAKEMNVPPRRYIQMCLSIRNAADIATGYWSGDQIDKNKNIERPLLLLSQAASHLAAQLKCLDTYARAALVACLDDEDEDDRAPTLQDCEFVLSVLQRAALYASDLGNKRRGAVNPGVVRGSRLGRPLGPANYPLSLLGPAFTPRLKRLAAVARPLTGRARAEVSCGCWSNCDHMCPRG
jgi:hypothetical protein